MVVPDFELIAEIMMVAEGFLEARLLARKFITLYSLCKELLSKQDHYDWGLRAIKSVLVVAGSLKRGDPGRPEDQVSTLTELVLKLSVVHRNWIHKSFQVKMFFSKLRFNLTLIRPSSEFGFSSNYKTTRWLT